MPTQRFKLFCPWCGAKLKTMDTADRIKQKLAPGSRIEKSVAKCPKCFKVILLKEPPPADRRALKIWGEVAVVCALLLGVILFFLMMM
jgi:hypothetical protein